LSPIPIILVGGGLGAGKTSLLRGLLAAPGLPRLGLVVNEFGDLDIDGAVLSGQGADVVKLPNGCVCCAAGGDLAAAVTRLLRAETPPEVVVVELSGVADPYPVVRELELLAGATRLANLVAVVDLELPPSAAVADPALLRVLSLAHTVVLNKRDRAAAERARGWADLAQASNPRAAIHETSFGRLAPQVLLSPPAAPALAATPPGRAAHRAYHAVTVAVPAGLPREQLAHALDAPEWVDRAKGFVNLAEGPFLFQVVRGAASFEPLAAPPPASVANKVVVISGDAALLHRRVADLWRADVHSGCAQGDG
jgi:G3E family GTPase